MPRQEDNYPDYGTENERGLGRSAKEIEEVLTERARLLAREDTHEEEGESVVLVKFVLAEEQYGIDGRFVMEVAPLREITPLPHTPDFVIGIINVRGKIISVFDIKRFLNLPLKGITDLNKLILIASGQNELGILADFISGVRQVKTTDILPLPVTQSDPGSDFLSGVTADGLIILNAQKLLMDRRFTLDDGKEAAPP